MLCSRFTLILLCFFSASALAGESYRFNPEKSLLELKLNYVGFAPLRITLPKFSGSFYLDKEHPEKNHTNLVIRTRAVQSNVSSFNDIIRGEKFFDAQTYPKMIFVCDKMVMHSETEGLMHGKLQIKNVVKPLTMTLNYVDKAYKDKPGIVAKSVINRSDFDMTYGIPLVSDRTEITMLIQMD